MKRLLLALASLCLLHRAAGFIRIFRTSFADEDCKEFAFVGANTWRMLEAQGGMTGVKVNNQNPATNLLDTAAALNLTVLRVFATGVEPELQLQTEPGVYNQAALKALDQVVADAADRGLRLVLILARNWGGPDSRAQYASWNGLQSPDDFYASPAARQAYKDHVAFMVNRVNTVNGRTYRDDPAIFSWNLMNEPRFFINGTDDPCAKNPQQCTDALQSWIEEMSAFLKAQDPNHLVTVGEEGFYGNGRADGQNPQPNSNWAPATGQDFIANHRVDSIDYAAFHLWPDNWNVSNDFMQSWIASHEAAARDMNKPLVLEEFGKNVSDQNPSNIESVRNPVFRTVMGALNDSLAAGDVLKGAMYWMWDSVLVDESSNGWERFSQDQVFPSSSTMKEIIQPTAQHAAQYKGSVPGCTPEGSGAPAGRKLLRAPSK